MDLLRTCLRWVCVLVIGLLGLVEESLGLYKPHRWCTKWSARCCCVCFSFRRVVPDSQLPNTCFTHSWRSSFEITQCLIYTTDSLSLTHLFLCVCVCFLDRLFFFLFY
ncbi:hypothetical protein PO909_026565 [Leuciscus waleckii]